MPQLSRLSLRPLVLAAVLALGAVPAVSPAQTTPYVATEGTLLNVSAQAEARRAPDIAKLGKIMDALVATGANQINGPTFDLDDAKKEAAYDEARRAAVEKAQARAEMYAKTLGRKVRRIVSISEGGSFAPPRPMPMMAMKAMDRAESTPISPGENVLSVNLDVVFELGN